MSTEDAISSTRQRILSKGSLVESELRARILDGRLAPGARLQLRPLAEELGVSVMPVRDALRSLSAEGLVYLQDHRGAVVSELSSQEIFDCLGTRMWLEVDAVRNSVARLQTTIVAGARAALDDCKAALDAGDATQFSASNRDFHVQIESGADELTRGLISDLWNSFWRSRRGASLYLIRPDHMEVAHREHEMILDAAKSGDAEMTAKAMELHRHSTMAVWRDALADVAQRQLAHDPQADLDDMSEEE